MIVRSTMRGLVGVCLMALAACTTPRTTLGTDPETRTTATQTTWSDGRSAIAISCEIPQGCQSRALALCKGNNYTVLSMENMPTRGDATVVRGPASVTLRCG